MLLAKIVVLDLQFLVRLNLILAEYRTCKIGESYSFVNFNSILFDDLDVCQTFANTEPKLQVATLHFLRLFRE